MSRNRLLFIVALAVAGGTFVALRLRSPTTGLPERPAPPPPRVERPKPALQSEAEGYYVPGYEFTVNGYRFAGFSLRPEALVAFASATPGTKDQESCSEAQITAATVHLRCDFPREGTVTIEGRFLTRLATSRLDAAVLSAVVTVRSGNGDVLYNARDSFAWHQAQ
jgi:hypothetical protein